MNKLILLSTLTFSFFTFAVETTKIGDVDLGETEHSEAFLFIKNNMLGKWKGKLTQDSGNVINASYHFKLVSNGNTIREELIEDGVEMFTTYSDKDGELVIKHYCALGTEPMFKVARLSSNSIAFKSDPQPGYHKDHHNFVRSIAWEMVGSNKMIMKNSIFIDGKIENNKASIKRTY